MHHFSCLSFANRSRHVGKFSKRSTEHCGLAFLSFVGKKVGFYQAQPNKETKNVTGISEKGKIQQNEKKTHHK